MTTLDHAVEEECRRILLEEDEEEEEECRRILLEEEEEYNCSVFPSEKEEEG
jgi:hypothetical protein